MVDFNIGGREWHTEICPVCGSSDKQPDSLFRTLDEENPLATDSKLTTTRYICNTCGFVGHFIIVEGRSDNAVNSESG